MATEIVFTIVQEIQPAQTEFTFKIIQEIQQPKQNIDIVRVKS